MSDAVYILTHDIGTTGCKTCLYKIGDRLEQVNSCYEEYPLFMTPDGGAEQRVDDWWGAVCKATRRTLARHQAAGLGRQRHCLLLPDAGLDPDRPRG